MSEWKEYKLGELIQSISETYKLKPREKVVFLNTSDILDGKFLTDNLSEASTLPGQAKKKIQKGDILYSEIRPANKRFALVDFDCDNYVVSTKLMVLRCNDNVDNRFIYNYLTSKEVLEYLQMVAEDRSGTFPQITFDIIANMDIELPTIEEQRRIASILTSLDDKIDLLRRENLTLEAMAETLFRQWFVVEAKEDDVALGDVIKTTSGGTPSRKCAEYYENGTICWVKSKELDGSFISSTEELITEDAVSNSSAKRLPEKSVLIAMYGATVGEYGILSKSMTCNQAVCALIPNENYPFTYLFVWAASMKQEFINLATGAAQQNISQDLIKQQYVSSDVGKIKEYDNRVRSLFDKIENNQKQIQTLIQTRDGLLPRLMSNEIKI